MEPNGAQGVSNNSATSERHALIAALPHPGTFPGQTDAPKQIPEALSRANRIEHRIDCEIGHPNSAISVGSLKPFVGLLPVIQSGIDLYDAVRRNNLGSTSLSQALLPFRSIPQLTLQSAARRRSSSPRFSEITPPSPSRPNRVPALVRSPVSRAPFQKSLTLASLAAFISAPHATSATRWVEPQPISSRRTPCARWSEQGNYLLGDSCTPLGAPESGTKVFS